jgi:hypothetical protein
VNEAPWDQGFERGRAAIESVVLARTQPFENLLSNVREEAQHAADVAAFVADESGTDASLHAREQYIEGYSAGMCDWKPWLDGYSEGQSESAFSGGESDVDFTCEKYKTIENSLAFDKCMEGFMTARNERP